MASSPLTTAGFQPAQEGRRRGFGSLVLLFLLPAAIFGGLVAYSHFKPTKAATPEQGTLGQLVWGDGKVIFSNKQQLAAWLRLHGSSYSAFVKRHPEALRLVTAKPRKHVAPTPAKQAAPRPAKQAAPAPPKQAATHPVAKPTKAVPTVTTSAASLTTQGGGKSGSETLVFRIAAAFGVLSGLFALVPPVLLRRLGVRSSGELELRFSAAAVSVAILAGLLFGVLIG